MEKLIVELNEELEIVGSDSSVFSVWPSTASSSTDISCAVVLEIGVRSVVCIGIIFLKICVQTIKKKLVFTTVCTCDNVSVPEEVSSESTNLLLLFKVPLDFCDVWLAQPE